MGRSLYTKESVTHNKINNVTPIQLNAANSTSASTNNLLALTLVDLAALTWLLRRTKKLVTTVGWNDLKITNIIDPTKLLENSKQKNKYPHPRMGYCVKDTSLKEVE